MKIFIIVPLDFKFSMLSSDKERVWRERGYE